jgi:hypothetical protein
VASVGGGEVGGGSGGGEAGVGAQAGDRGEVFLLVTPLGGGEQGVVAGEGAGGVGIDFAGEGGAGLGEPVLDRGPAGIAALRGGGVVGFEAGALPAVGVGGFLAGGVEQQAGAADGFGDAAHGRPGELASEEMKSDREGDEGPDAEGDGTVGNLAEAGVGQGGQDQKREEGEDEPEGPGARQFGQKSAAEGGEIGPQSFQGGVQFPGQLAFGGGGIDGDGLVGKGEGAGEPGAENPDEGRGVGFEEAEFRLPGFEAGAEGGLGGVGCGESGVAFARGPEHVALEFELAPAFLGVDPFQAGFADVALGFAKPLEAAAVAVLGRGTAGGPGGVGVGQLEGETFPEGGLGGLGAATFQLLLASAGFAEPEFPSGEVPGQGPQTFQAFEDLEGSGQGVTHSPSLLG